ncbi:carbamoyltransferase HypF [Marihabitans asiaticum]|uniref:acylphosphatase n=1 Tax=Marihabitans asiaticum TaxID=415218 RepID=A0A560WG64_9MICO|nr:carbamoyltransferase HypF [Marihabitans asiaticum]TWD16667.1 hydrogenase maturation carbamoyltransferase HypF [Marihabitans asiaticum]
MTPSRVQTEVRPPDSGAAAASGMAQTVRRRLVVRGVVQGVGFRPHVARLAGELGLAGWCRNDSTAVEIEVAGPVGAVDAMIGRVVAEAPRLARVARVDELDPTTRELPSPFAIDDSQDRHGELTMIPPDTAPCERCLAELSDPADRRYRHPFVTCTHCGPRLSITRALPYDRASTTLADFAMCDRCAAEYTDPADRRYHAQPISCHDCGPRIALRDADGSLLAEATEDVLERTVAAIADGRIVAVKGIGGYHLACDAANAGAVAALRARKQRPSQPFAVMAADLETAGALVDLGCPELLDSPERPIVLLPARDGAPICAEVAPGLGETGVVLPYSPLHHLLFASTASGRSGPRALVMTSGNISSEPLCYRDEDALERLAGIADLFLTHDRPIAVPVEDSVLAWSERTGPVALRRSRGYAPLPVELGAGRPVVIAAGAELKNTVTVVRDGKAFVSGHVGDLESLASREAHARVVEQMLAFHRASPGVVASDTHPGYTSRAWAQARAGGWGVRHVEVQHHHAHLASLAAEHGLLGEDLVGLVLDGTGYGCDATIWGGELLRLRDGGRVADRLGHLGAVRLPGGDAGVRNPCRTAALALLDAGVELDGTAPGDELTDAEASYLRGVARTGTGASVTSSTGRLVDVLASIIGVRHRIDHDAQAAIELEASAARWLRANPGLGGVCGDRSSEVPRGSAKGEGAAEGDRSSEVPRGSAKGVPDLPFALAPVDDPTTPQGEGGPTLVLDPRPLVRATAAAAPTADPGALAFAVHRAIAAGMAELAAASCERTGTTTVGLTGGVFVNRLLLHLVATDLTRRGLTPLRHRLVPANDGGLSLGQAAVAWRTLSMDETTDTTCNDDWTPALPSPAVR